MGKKILAVLSGAITMVIIDALLAKVPHVGFTIGISASVLIGGAVASLVSGNHGWVFGLLGSKMGSAPVKNRLVHNHRSRGQAAELIVTLNEYKINLITLSMV